MKNREKQKTKSTTELSNKVEATVPSKAAGVTGRVRPLLPEGPRVMTCVDHKLRSTRFGDKHYLLWQDKDTRQLLEQYFSHYEAGYPREGKALRNYAIAFGKRADEIEGFNLEEIVGLTAEVQVETVRRKYTSGALKGQPQPGNMDYSKVSEILKPIAHRHNQKGVKQ